MPLLWAMKGSYFGFGSPQQQVDMHAGSKNTFIVNMHLFLPYLHKESKTIRSTFNFSKPLLCVMLICSDWYDWSHLHFILPVKQCLWAQCCIVYSVTGETFFATTKAAPSGKEWICIFIQTNAKDPQVGGQFANVSCWHQHETAWIHF